MSVNGAKAVVGRSRQFDQSPPVTSYADVLLSSLPDGGPPLLKNWMMHQSMNAPTGIIHQRLLIRLVTFVGLPSSIGEGRAINISAALPLVIRLVNGRKWGATGLTAPGAASSPLHCP